MKKFLSTLALGCAMAVSTSAMADEVQVKMLNRGEAGAMVFEPSLIEIKPGDTVRFLPTDKGHNAETIKGMIPDGAEPFKSKYNEEFVVTFDQEGVYGVRCKPHYAMGMVALIKVGEPVNLDAAQTVKQPGKAKTAFADLFGLVVASR
ncbi:pseudoazurin [Roseibium salinum]|uniref:Pseudoazurin n=1 Tax=Roseibium salinum TaxID=1604349 RepID=A0ABT3R9L0_9HYPH|nr:pseudoazurin [Roseibium sp. DSM 29163]MCX2725722.1 pseudoazurin [Roseibium sp. DSM 29163]